MKQPLAEGYLQPIGRRHVTRVDVLEINTAGDADLTVPELICASVILCVN